MPNRPDLHFNTTFTQGTLPSGELDPNSPLASVEDQPADEQLVNPRNLRRFNLSIQSHGFPPLNFTFDRMRTRYLSWSVDSHEVIATHQGFNFWDPSPPTEVEGFTSDGTIRNWDGNTEGFGVGGWYSPLMENSTPYGNPLARGIGAGMIDATHGYTDAVLVCNEGIFYDPPPPEGESTVTIRYYFSLKDPWTSYDTEARLNRIRDAIAGRVEEITDGTEATVTISDAETIGSIEQLGTVDEATRYTARTTIFSRPVIETFYIGYPINDEWRGEYVWCFPLGGFTIQNIAGTAETHGEDGNLPACSFVAGLKHLRRGNYDGNDGGDEFIAIESNGGYLMGSTSFGIATDFRLSNYEIDQLSVWRQIRFFEDMPWVDSVDERLATIDYFGTYVDIYGLWLPTRDPQAVLGSVSKWWKIEFRNIATGEIIEMSDQPPGTGGGRIVSEAGDAGVDAYRNGRVTVIMENRYSGTFHMRIETDIGHWDSSEFPKYINGLFTISGQP